MSKACSGEKSEMTEQAASRVTRGTSPRSLVTAGRHVGRDRRSELVVKSWGTPGSIPGVDEGGPCDDRLQPGGELRPARRIQRMPGHLQIDERRSDRDIG